MYKLNFTSIVFNKPVFLNSNKKIAGYLGKSLKNTRKVLVKLPEFYQLLLNIKKELRLRF